MTTSGNVATAVSTGSSQNSHEPVNESTSRVVMLWPSDLKAELQAKVGKRGLTAYVLDAVRAKHESELVQEVVVQHIECMSCHGVGAHRVDCWLA